MGLLLGLDIGTSGIKALLLDAQNQKVVAQSLVELSLSTPHNGWAEQHPEEWWQATCQTVQKLPAKLRDDVEALSFSGQMHGLVLLDSQDQVLRPAIMWCDTRTTESCQQIIDQVGLNRVLEKTMNPPLEGFTLPKLLWVATHEPELIKQAHTLLLPKDYIRFRMTGQKGIERSDASGTLMLDMAAGQWDKELLENLSCDPLLLPDLIDSSQLCGTLSSQAAADLGLNQTTAVFGGGADNACAALGCGVVRPGLAALSLGSSGTMILPSVSAKRDPAGRVHTFNHAVDDMFYLMGVHQASGLSLRWLKNLFNEKNYASMIETVADVAPGSDGLLYAPWLNGERTPLMDGQARGAFIGLASHHTRSHLIRAVLEGVAFSFRTSFEIFRELKLPIEQCFFVGGGARSQDWGQIIANVLNISLRRLSQEEGPAYGAALIAGVGQGHFQDFNEASAGIIVKDEIKPHHQGAQKMDALFQNYQKIYDCNRPLFSPV